MGIDGPVAVTGPGGRVGSALVAALERAGIAVVPWPRPDFDLDRPLAADRLVERDTPAAVFHCAAWTDVDGCARDPGLAMRRNGEATAELARACAAAGVDLVYVSTNEVFSGARDDGQGYREDDPVDPPNPYGRSKLAGEEAMKTAFHGKPGGRAWVVRTSWIFGSPGGDFPARILRAADAVGGTAALRVVADEIGRPTFASDLAQALVQLVSVGPAGVYHVANEGIASRFDVARAVFDRCRPETELEPIRGTDYARASTPPPWGVLDTTRASGYGITLRPWAEALSAYLAGVCPER